MEFFTGNGAVSTPPITTQFIDAGGVVSLLTDSTTVNVVPLRRKIEGMKMLFTGKYGQAKTVRFSLIQPDGINFESGATFEVGDVVLMSDEGVEVNTTNLPTDEGLGYSLVLTVAEMTAARIKLYIIDQTGPKLWLDTDLDVETYGDASAEHEFDNDAAALTAAQVTTDMDANSTNLNTIISNQSGQATVANQTAMLANQVNIEAKQDTTIATQVSQATVANQTAMLANQVDIEAKQDTTIAAQASQATVANQTAMLANQIDIEAKQDTTITNLAVTDARLTDGRAEPGQGAPGKTVSVLDKIDHMYKRSVNKVDVAPDGGGTSERYYNSDGTVVDHKRTLTDAAGVTTKADVVAGP